MDKDLLALQEVRDRLLRAKEAARALRGFSQERVDTICRAMAMAGSREAARLARMAVEETGMGVVRSKEYKNRVASELLWDAIRDMKTVGVIGRDEANGVVELAAPMGTVAAIIPTTNPTSTAIYKAIISLKARNPIVVSPHPRATRCIAEACRVVGEAAERAGAPRHAVQCLEHVTLGATQALMSHPLTGVILATGGPDLVKAAYSSGKPALGVGAGNPPAIIDTSADIALAARMLVLSQTFDNGTICASEQSIVCLRPLREAMLAELRRQGCHICSAEEIRKLEKIVVRGKRQNPAIVGQYPRKIAQMAGFRVPDDTTVLICEYEGVGFEHPLSIEKLSPILTFYTVSDLEAAIRQADALLRFGGDGHTLAIYTQHEETVLRLADQLPACRIMVNAPTSQGAVGFATALLPSLTLGCGTFGNNISSNNIGPLDLINRKRVGWVRPEITRPDFDPDAFFAELRARAYGVRELGGPGPVRPYLHPKAAASNTAPRGVTLPKLERGQLERILTRSLGG
ncbi:MAG: aldehyde dehydrogenase family protein [Planctomycetota bacterium]|nr:MAG: aldehyde dehydrogenase family protein [Planctomycetota bacterium]